MSRCDDDIVKPLVAVSACLLGQKVRYDGQAKYQSLIAEELSQYCHLVAVCPELAIGLGVPRAKIQLTRVGGHNRILQQGDAKIDLTDDLVDFATQFSQQQDWAGMVLQDKSPSCGLSNTQLFSVTGTKIGLSTGLFAATIMDIFPDILLVQASQLQSKQNILQFVKNLSHN